jgi:hypothetical protein
MSFIEGELFRDKRRNLIVYESFPLNYLQEVVMSFIE